MSVVDFHYGRRARNHVAGQAVRDGFDTNGDKVNYDNPEPSNWPDIRQRIVNAKRCLSDLKVLTEDPRSSQELIGFTAQQALENALKGWISALDADYVNTHDLADPGRDCEAAFRRKRHPRRRASYLADRVCCALPI